MPAKAIEKNGSTYKNHLAGNILLHFYNQALKAHIVNKEIKTALIDFFFFYILKGWNRTILFSDFFLNKYIENVLKVQILMLK